MMRSLYTGVSGLTNHQTRMDVLSNNIANVNTIGFKSSRTIFQDSLSQTMQGATAPRANVGGINAKQIGLGVKTASIDILFTKTSFQTTNVNTDLAINNNGFFIVNNGGQSYYTRAGNFYFDSEGNFVTNEGLRVMGWPADKVSGAINTSAPVEPLKISITATMEPKITKTVTFNGNLMADAVLGEAKSATKDVYDAEGYAHRLSTMYTKVGDNQWLAYTSITGAKRSTSPPTPNEDDIVGNVKIVSFDPNGKFQNVQDLSMTLPDLGSTGNFTSGSPFSGAVNLNSQGVLGQTAGSVIIFTDYNGAVRAIGVKATCTKGDSTGVAGDAEWQLVFSENGQTVGSGSYSATSVLVPGGSNLPTVTLSDGTAVNLAALTEKVGVAAAATNLNTPAVTAAGNTALSYIPDNTVNPNPHVINVSYTDPNYGELVQYAGGFNLGDPYQDGYAAGDLMDKTINAAGVIVGTYSNGQQLNLGQVATCIFNNQQGLERAGSTLFTKSNNSGDPIIGEAGVGGRGTLQAGVLEMANVDLAEEFTNMIVTQRGYQSNSRIITTSDELLQELMNLKR
ncbi:MAG: flagellar hook protein FlgE [Acidaminococcales bacterium]|jgi:flagellar hook protein FlgE|nr:flagellar hook protein FlgE [Acidaminococcales bacterium]